LTRAREGFFDGVSGVSGSTYTAIIAAIDAAILEGVSGPGEITFRDGRKLVYRSLDDLIRARATYVSLKNAASGSSGFVIRKKQNGGAV